MRANVYVCVRVRVYTFCLLSVRRRRRDTYGICPVGDVLPVIYRLAFLCAPDWTNCTWPCWRTPAVPRSRTRTGSCSRTGRNGRPRKTCGQMTTDVFYVNVGEGHVRTMGGKA